MIFLKKNIVLNKSGYNHFLYFYKKEVNIMQMSLFDYKNFDSKTKEYINIAMSIYNTISEKSLSIRIKKL